jgi:hypothetical protein
VEGRRRPQVATTLFDPDGERARIGQGRRDPDAMPRRSLELLVRSADRCLRGGGGGGRLQVSGGCLQGGGGARGKECTRGCGGRERSLLSTPRVEIFLSPVGRRGLDRDPLRYPDSQMQIFGRAGDSTPAWVLVPREPGFGVDPPQTTRCQTSTKMVGVVRMPLRNEAQPLKCPV